jgi:hypothetical protein
MMMLLAGALITSCTESPIGQTPTDSVPPSPLTNVAIDPIAGGANITYDLPNETDIAYVRCDYLFQGAKKSIYVSAYDNHMTIEGLGSTDPVEVSLYVVDHSKNASLPVTGAFVPRTPAIEDIYESLKMNADLGGVTVEWTNVMGIEIGVALFAYDSLNVYQQRDIHFVASKDGKHSFRGYDSIEQKFGVQLTDKWGNMSPIKEWTLTPIFEELLDRTKHKQYKLPWDNTSDQYGQVFSLLFDGEKITTGSKSWHTKENESLYTYGFTWPVMFTIDLGAEATVSRFLLWQGRYDPSYFLYGHHNPKTFEVWGITNIPERSNEYWQWEGSWKSDWTLLGDYEIVKPSGLPDKVYTAEDIAVADAGHEFILTTTSARYLRFAVKSTFIGDRDNVLTLHELSFYGMWN